MELAILIFVCLLCFAGISHAGMPFSLQSKYPSTSNTEKWVIRDLGPKKGCAIFYKVFGNKKFYEFKWYSPGSSQWVRWRFNSPQDAYVGSQLHPFFRGITWDKYSGEELSLNVRNKLIKEKILKGEIDESKT